MEIDSLVLDLLESQTFFANIASVADPVTGAIGLVPTQLTTISDALKADIAAMATEPECTCGLCANIPEEQPTEDEQVVLTDINNLLISMNSRI